MQNLIDTIFFSLLAGLLPALIWLWFWLREDREHPEPRKLILYAFLGGMGAVILAIPIELLFQQHIPQSITLVALWAGTEELLKFGMASLIVLNRKTTDEPLDDVIYMMTTALGFAALENALFIFSPLYYGTTTSLLFTLNLRFIGATLLHLIASSSIGVALAFTFYKSRPIKTLAVLIGLIVAITLHTLFNLSIIDGSGGGVLLVFAAVWFAILVLILIIEKIKRIQA